MNCASGLNVSLNGELLVDLLDSVSMRTLLSIELHNPSILVADLLVALCCRLILVVFFLNNKTILKIHSLNSCYVLILA